MILQMQVNIMVRTSIGKVDYEDIDFQEGSAISGGGVLVSSLRDRNIHAEIPCFLWPRIPLSLSTLFLCYWVPIQVLPQF